MDEKLPLAQLPTARPTRPSSVRSRWIWSPLFLVGISLLYLRGTFLCSMSGDKTAQAMLHKGKSDQCVQVDPLHPVRNTPDLIQMDEFLRSSTFRNESVLRLSGAVQIKTVSFDDMGTVEDDDRWNVFYDMSKYLEVQFPLVNRTLTRERVNTHGLLYTWQGYDPLLKPTLLMAHQDVVPVAESTIDQWEHGPFDGDYDGKYIWGRGSSDCKNTLIGTMEAVEQLIQAGFEPKRTLILSFGFDEEISGRRGAGHLANHLLSQYKKTGGAAVILDEGGSTLSQWGTNFAVPGVTEKGYTDIEVIVRLPGGHSSIPPPHTGIGVAAELISAIEAEPFESHFSPENPFLDLMQCAATHSSEFPKKLKKLLRHHRPLPPGKHDKLADEAAKLGPAVKYLFTTSQAVDIIDGGVKANALPERTRFLTNFRINLGESSADVNNKITKIAATVAKKHNLTLHAFSNETETPSSITLVASDNTLEPAPVTPTSVDTTTPYSILSGTLRALYGESLIVAPALMTGNTDTRYYWDLSDHIFRYNPGWDPDAEEPFKSIHTVNEKVSVVNHITTVQWYSLFIRNMDEAVLE